MKNKEYIYHLKHPNLNVETDFVKAFVFEILIAL